MNGKHGDGLNDILTGLREILGVGVDADLSDVGVDKLLSEVIGALTGSVGDILSFLLLLIGLAVMTRLSELLPERVTRIAEGGVGIIVSFMLFSRLYPLIIGVSDSIGKMTELFSLLMPLVISFIAIGGGVTLAPAASVGMQLTLFVMSLFSSEVLIKVVLLMLTLGALSGIERGVVGRISRGVKSIFTKLVGFLTVSLSALIALQTYVGSARDGAAIRLARFTAQDIIPMVGSSVSGALGTLAGGLEYVGGILGGVSVVAILSVALSPLLILLGYRLAFFVCEFLLDFSGNSGGVLTFSGFRSALDALISVYAMTMIVYILELVVLVMGGASIIG